MKVPLCTNLSYLLPFLVALWSPGAAQLKNTFTMFGRGVQKEIQAVKQPIDETITFVGTTSCSHVKRLVGVDYEQVLGLKEPDLNELTLNFRSREIKTSYNLSSAARLVSEARGYDPHASLIIFLHGFTDNPTKTNFANISEAFLSKGEFNILGLDASSLIRWLYLRSSTYVRFIGERLGEVLAAMVQKGQNPNTIHLIGHSLGSHISSFAGKQFTELTGLKVGRISGLDPAGPCFSHIDPELRLKATDAQFVDVIHTDSGVYGLEERVGHIDFYPNGGSLQPNCLLQTCSHGRVVELYAESIINPDAFVGKACDSYAAFKQNKCPNVFSVMGYGTRPGSEGEFYLRTGEDLPYGLGEKGTQWINNEGIVRGIGGHVGKLLRL